MAAVVMTLCFLLQPLQGPDHLQEPAHRPDYVVGAGDVLSISVFGLREFDQVARVSNSGKIHVPYLGVLKVHGLSLQQVESNIEAGLIEHELIKEPWVQVRVIEYRAHPVYILGEVQQPGQFLITGDMTVLDLISLAGAFNEVYSHVGYLYRYRNPQTLSSDDYTVVDASEQEVIKIEFSELYSDPKMNVRLRGGDILYVPERKKNFFFVVGDVLAPGAYELFMGDDELLVTQAVAKAGGPLRTAKSSKGILVRYVRGGKREELPVDFRAILRGKKPNLPILPNDIVYIPGSSAKTLGYGLLNIIPGLAEGIVAVP